MNERMRELTKEHYCRHEYDNGHVHEYYEFNEDELEKLSQLIIQDCINICRQEWFDENNKVTVGLPSRDIAIHLGEKLGIERCVNALARMKNEAM